MRAEDLYEAIGEVSDELLEESEEISGRAGRKILMYRRFAAAAAAVLVLGAGAYGISHVRMGSASYAGSEMAAAEAATEEPAEAAAAAEEEAPYESAPAEAAAAMTDGGNAAEEHAVPVEEAEDNLPDEDAAVTTEAEHSELAAAPAAREEGTFAEEAAAADTGAEENLYDNFGDTEETGAVRLLSNVLAPSHSAVLLPDDGQNHVVSPLNISMALALLSETTAGETQKQILDVLGVSSVEELREAAAAILAKSGREDAQGTELIANSLWLREEGTDSRTEVMRDFLEMTYGAQTFTGKMGSKEFNDLLHKWLDENTRGLLTNEANSVDFSQETILALASALYYKANWTTPFNENTTRDMTFHAPSGDRDVPFLGTGTLGYYYRGEHFGAVYLTLSDGNYFWLFLPDEGRSVKDVTTDPAMLRIVSDPHSEDGTYAALTVRFPKFDVASSADLCGPLEAMGIRDVFDAGKADFTPLSGKEGNAAVSSISHAARTTVDEYGVTAAAFTVVIAEGAAMEPEKQIEFVCDRPFLFAVTDDEGLICFEGAVAEP